MQSLFLTLAVLAMGCAGTSGTGLDRPVVGIIMVGQADDLGYNQAVAEGAAALARQLPNVDVLVVPEIAEDEHVAAAALEELIDQGASILFATSFGHMAAARRVATAHPDVVVVQQGALEGAPDLPNLGTYFGHHSQPVTVAGIAAGAASTSGHIGMVLAFPIPASYANANALLIGALRVRPDIRMSVVFTSSWCDPDAQEVAVTTLRDAGVDVLSQHQDCSRTVLRQAEEHGLPVVGYHADGREVAPSTWLTGAVWNWGPLYADIVTTALRGEFAGSEFDGDFRGGLGSSRNPFVLSPPTQLVQPATRDLMAQVADELAGSGTPFVGPIDDTDGRRRVDAGVRLTAEEVESLDWFIEGVTVLR